MQLILDEQQQLAVELLLTENIGIVTGGPGTGKTTILRSFLEQCGVNKGTAHVLLLAPTGRAARRIAEVTGYAAKTIHRWLVRDGADTLQERSVIIVDEASMLDVETLAMLISAINIDAWQQPPRLFFLGDADQLPSVGPGNVLADLIESGGVKTVRLERVYRSKEDSWVANAAAAILQGEFPFEPGPGFEFIHADRDLVERVVAAATPLSATQSTLVLVPQNVGDFGAAALNAAIQAHENPHDADSFSVQGAPGLRHHIKPGDRVIATINDYERMVFNGDTGFVVEVEGRGSGAVEVRFDDGSTHTYTKTEASETLRLAYVLTVHKAQGSEARRVILVAAMAHSYMLTRRLFYTAVTRAQEKVIIVGQREGIEHAVSNTAESERLTTLCDRIRDGR